MVVAWLHFRCVKRGGANFYISKDGQFYFKTMSNNDREVFLGMLNSYKDHIVKNPSTRLLHYYAIVRIGMHDTSDFQNLGKYIRKMGHKT